MWHPFCDVYELDEKSNDYIITIKKNGFLKKRLEFEVKIGCETHSYSRLTDVVNFLLNQGMCINAIWELMNKVETKYLRVKF